MSKKKPTRRKSTNNRSRRYLGKPAKGRKPARTGGRKRGPMPADPTLASVAPQDIKPTQVRAPITDCAAWERAAQQTSEKLGLAKPMGRAVWLRWLANIAAQLNPQVMIDLIPPAPVVVAQTVTTQEVVEPEPAGQVTPSGITVVADVIDDASLVAEEQHMATVAEVLAKNPPQPARSPNLAPRDPEADPDEPTVEYTP